jgi:predicted phosphodiesterase
VTAVRGNNDTGAWARKLGSTALLRAGRKRIFVLHDLEELAIDPAAARGVTCAPLLLDPA